MKKEEPIILCFASDDNYAPYMGMAIFSIMRNANPGEKFRIYVLDNKISEENKEKIEILRQKYHFYLIYLPLDEKIFAECDTKSPNWTLSIFGRYLIPKLIPEEKVLYLDCDIMARDSLAVLWKTDLSNYYLAGVPDYNAIQRDCLKERFGKEFKEEEYVNSGVLLINNKKWKRESLFEKLLDYTLKNPSLLKCPDQDVINFVCRSSKKMLPERYNVQGHLYKSDLFSNKTLLKQIEQERNLAVLRHFHPWKKNLFVPNRDEYLGLMRVSPWRDLVPQDDPFLWAWIKIIFRYLWRHPFCFFIPKFYKRWKMRGWNALFIDY